MSSPINSDEWEALARSRLDPAVYDYFAGGADDEVTLAANRAAFARLQLRPRVLRGVEHPSLETTVLGLPVKLVGVGEGVDDLRPFDARDYARALVA